MSDASSIFTGASRYSSDFQSLINRAVAIASLPLGQLTAAKTTLEAESSALGTLNTKFTSLQSAVSSLETATGISSYAVSVSNGLVVSASASTGATAGAYSIEVTSLGSNTSTMSKAGLTTVTDPSTQNISSASDFTLTVNGTPHSITPSGTTLNALVTAINDAGLDMQASIVNVGSTSSPDYRLAIQSSKLGAETIQLNDGSQDLLDTLAAGAKATYKLNGMATAIESDSRTITLAPGLTAQLLGESASGVATTITVSRSTMAITNALASFVTAYNAGVDELDKHRGEAGGALTGQSIVSMLSDAMRNVAQYSGGPDTITSLTDLGLSFDDKGKLSLDTSTFSSATTGNIDELMTFLGSSTGGGFLKSATDTLNGLEDTTDGILTTAISSMTAQITGQTSRITTEQERVADIQENLTAQMSAADALIAALEQQATYLNALFESMRIASQVYL